MKIFKAWIPASAGMTERDIPISVVPYNKCGPILQ